jgi:NTP pyrophosphatase (non-canonical NTP hydrolase)
MTFKELETATLNWGRAKNIVGHSQQQIKAQLSKTEEEVEELKQSINDFFNSKALITDVQLELGDVLVTLILVAECLELDLETSLAAAYTKIKNRTGKTVNGVFVKDSA